MLFGETREPVVPVFLTHQWYTRRPALMRWLQCVHLCHVHLTPTSEFVLPAMVAEVTSVVNRVLHKTHFSCGLRLQLIIRILYLSVTLLWNLCFVITHHKSYSHRRKLTQSCRLLIFLSVYKEELPSLQLNTTRSQINKGKLRKYFISFCVSFLWWL